MPSAAAWRPYVLALAASAAAAAVTRATWPLLAPAPFVLPFSAVAAVTQWGSGAAGLLTVALSALGVTLAFGSPATPPFGWETPPLIIFAVVGLIGNRLIDGRNRAVAALRASEAELRATLAQMRASEEQLRRAQKMKAVGQLAAGVAHNFNNLLQVTMGYTDVLLDARHGDETDQAIDEIRKATERGAALTRQLMAFSRRQESRVARVDVDTMLGELREMLTRVVREDIELRVVAEGRAGVMIDRSDLEQTLLNLVINARDALPSGGTIQIEASRVTLDAAAIPAGQIAAPGDYVRLRVVDNGTGMSPEVQAHLFEPFFTTKEVGEGTGLGLAFVHGVAHHAGGFTTVDTAPGQGTTVTVFLPVAPGPAPAEEHAAPSPQPSRASRAASILLVEDEPGVRAATERILTRAGYRVLAAANAAEASALFDVHSASIDLLLTDVVMPGMHGPELAARLAALRPELPVVFVSGYSDQMPALQVVSSRAAFVPKPFAAAHLVKTVEGLLTGETR